jgi:hypothetical protein
MTAAAAWVVAAALAGVTLEPAAPEPPAEGAPRVALPLAIDKLWLRVGGGRRDGDLIVSEGGIEFTGRKRAFSYPFERIRVVSLGTMRGDVDTEWIVLAIGVRPPYELIGLRDGSKWGFGSRTREIYHQLRQVLKQQSAAQFRVPQGHVPYEDPEHACTFAIPEGWNSYLESLVVLGGRAAHGTTILSEQPVRRVERDGPGEARVADDLELLDRILAGESPGFFVERAAASRGMGCEGFSAAARESVLARAREDLVFGDGYEVLQAPVASAADLGGCRGLHVVGRSRRPDGAEVVLELYAAARGETLHLFGLRALSDRHAEHRGPFATAVATATFGVALQD